MGYETYFMGWIAMMGYIACKSHTVSSTSIRASCRISVLDEALARRG